MISVVAIASSLVSAIAVLQSTLLRFIELLGSQPDLVLVVVVFVANKNGMMTGQVTGFVGGVVLDSIGLAPLGFHAIAYAVIGALFGLTRGKVFVDPVLMPVLMGASGVLLKAMIGGLLAVLFTMQGVTSEVLSAPLWVELGYTALATPVLFALLGLIRLIQPDTRHGEVF